mmetsp:Transcript_37115/g.41480  ORF Transcript_37115/g.41480 Transcript_37115/m.41480 type:complete len:374 (-) Transcript_37115:123-1244(-)
MMSKMMYRKIMIQPEKFRSTDFATATKIVSVPVPESAGENEVMVRVTHAGVQASDIIQMSGGYGTLASTHPTPLEQATGANQPGDLGCEAVGVVMKVGTEVDSQHWPIGQPVCFFGYGVAFREVVTIPTSSLYKVPTAIPDWTAFPVSALTAMGGLEIVGKIRSLQNPSVLVTGAAGGTGHMAVQFAKVHGAKVAGTCGSTAKESMLRSIGCDVVLNYRTSPDVEDELQKAFPDGFDIVYDGVGGRIGDVGRRLLAAKGTFVGIGTVSEDYSGKNGADADNQTTASKATLKPGQREEFFFMPAGPKMVGQAGWDDMVKRTKEALAEGTVKVVLDAESSSYQGIEGIYEAQERMRSGQNVGKIYVSFPQPGGSE